jgi:hypothetical protein
MHGRLSMFAFVVYVALDLSSPFIPGAFNFNPEECVEAMHREQRQQVSVDSVPQTQRLRERLHETHRVVRRVPAFAARADRRARAPVAHVSAPPPSSPSEDH